MPAKKFKTKSSQVGSDLKPLIAGVANAVMRSEKHPEHRNKYLQLKKRRGYKKVIITITRRLLVANYNIIKKMYDTIQHSITIKKLLHQTKNYQFKNPAKK